MGFYDKAIDALQGVATGRTSALDIIRKRKAMEEQSAASAPQQSAYAKFPPIFQAQLSNGTAAARTD